MSKQSESRKALVDAAKDLLWRDGYEATSPRRVLETSGVGQGSLYHHFSGKKALALAALDVVAEELLAQIEALDQLATMDGPKAAIQAYFEAQMDGAKGCRLGRLVNETAFDDEELRAPLLRYFERLIERMTAWFSQAQTDGALTSAVPPKALATLAVSAIQGGYVLSRLERSDLPLRDAAEGAWTIIAMDFYDVESPA